MKEALATAFIMLLGAFAATHASAAMGIDLNSYYTQLLQPVIQQDINHQQFVQAVPKLVIRSEYNADWYVRQGINTLITRTANSIKSDHQADAWKRTIIDTIRASN